MMPFKLWFTLRTFSWAKVVHQAVDSDDPIPLAIMLDTRLRSMVFRYWFFAVGLVFFLLLTELSGVIPRTPVFRPICGLGLAVIVTALLHDAQLHWLLAKRHDLSLLSTRRYRLSFFLQPAQWWTCPLEVEHKELADRVLIVAGRYDRDRIAPRMKA